MPPKIDSRPSRPRTLQRYRVEQFAKPRTFAMAGLLIAPFLALVLCVSLLTSIVRVPSMPLFTQPGVSSATAPRPPLIAATTAFLEDAGTGQVLYDRGANDERAMASTTKVMTALLAAERGNLDATITIGADAAAMVRPQSSNMGLKAGEQLTLRELLYGLLLPSGNDAAVAIADSISGSQAAFVALMNQRAQELGMTHTHYMNPHGLDDVGHYTSAHDLVTVSVAAVQHPELVAIMSTLAYTIPATATHAEHKLATGNDLLPGAGSAYPGVIGVKPGYTGAAGFTMAFAAKRDGHLIVGAVMNDPSWQVRIGDMRALLDWGFTRLGIPAAGPDPKY
ncbi:MAG TPA: D-alanyl-D-alanine carboxypeptidase family protein, partial [Ktedonobacterales bacterium]